MQEKLPPTDSRLRPDQRYLENGEYEMANSEKLRLEQRQRQVNYWFCRMMPRLFFCIDFPFLRRHPPPGIFMYFCFQMMNLGV